MGTDRHVVLKTYSSFATSAPADFRDGPCVRKLRCLVPPRLVLRHCRSSTTAHGGKHFPYKCKTSATQTCGHGQ